MRQLSTVIRVVAEAREGTGMHSIRGAGFVKTFLVSLCSVLAVAGCSSSGGQSDSVRGAVLESESLGTLSDGQLTAILQQLSPALPPAQFSVALTKVTYRTIDEQTQLTTATGLLAVPQGAGKDLPLLVYHHSTETLRSAVPSNPGNAEAQLFVALFAGAGYVVAEPDYVGLGDSPGGHAYLNAAAEASAGRDLIRAVSSLTAEQGVNLSNLYVAGYSQGGHAAAATSRNIGTQRSDEFQISGTVLGDAPLDLTNITFPAVLARTGAPSSRVLAYFLVGANPQYHIYFNPSEAFTGADAQGIVNLFDGTHSTDEIDGVLPANPRNLLQPSFVQEQLQQPGSIAASALAASDITNWQPAEPVRLVHSRGDTLVPIANSEEAVSRITHGGGNAELVELSPDLDHEDAFVPFALAARALVDEMQGVANPTPTAEPTATPTPEPSPVATPATPTPQTSATPASTPTPEPTPTPTPMP